MKIGFLHTAQVHVGTFDAFLEGTGVTAIHHVDADLLARAQTAGLDAVRRDAHNAVAKLEHTHAVVCTCSTLGPLMDPEHVLRIDKPAFDHAITLGPRILIVICLESTSAPSEALLADCAQTAGVEVTPNTLICAAAWPCFETGDMDAFNTTIAHNVRNACNTETYDSVILAQASMAGAARLLRDLNAPVLTTPHMAVQAAIAAAKTRA